MFPFHVFVMALTNNTNNAAPLYIIFLAEGTLVKIPYAFVCTGPVGAEIKLGTVSDYVNFVPSPPPSPTETYVPRLPLRGRCANIITFANIQDEVPITRSSIFDRLIFLRES